jgi:hypothetical protein
MIGRADFALKLAEVAHAILRAMSVYAIEKPLL